MIYSVRDIELLRLLRWCRYIAVKDLRGVFDDTTIQNLKAAKLIRQGTSRRALALTAKGNALVESLFDDLPENTRLAHTAVDMQRRVRVSGITLTAYQAGLNVYTRELSGLARVFTLKDDMLRELGVSLLYKPPQEAYRTEKGEVIDAPLIQAARKGGGSGNQ